ncbi:MAG: DUF1592 domain-containing protein [Planctomycetota bacterium]|nr:DUF1592 domain-containing protein [Planctomycetota bacterium]
MIRSSLLSGVLVVLSVAGSSADDAFEANVRPLLQQYCFTCHRGDEPQGDFSLETLNAEFGGAVQRRPWQKILVRLTSGEMPPEGKPQPTADERTLLRDAIASQIHDGEQRERATQGRVVFRRLNRTEYEHTINDLLGVHVELIDLLPLDSSSDGFDNVGDALHVSSFLLERYLEAADVALDAAIANGPQPPLIKQRYTLQDSHQVRSTTESVYRKSDDGRVVMFSSSAWNAVSLSPFYPPHRGDYRFRLSTSAIQSDDKPVTYRVDAGLMLMTGKPHLVDYFDAPADETRIVEFTDSLQARETIRILPYGLEHANTLNKIGQENYTGPGLAVDWVEAEGPLHESWPPESHRRIFGDLPQAPAPTYNRSDRVEVVSNDPLVDADRILRNFAVRAFRKGVDDDDVQPYVDLFARKLEEGQSFEQSVRVALTAMLVSPDFLFLRETPGRLDDFALACRLSYFLWSSMPDDELFRLAAVGELTRNDDALHQQIERMLDDPKAERFVKNFTGQWLQLRDIDFTTPSVLVYPEFDDMLKESMLREVELFFTELINNDLDIANFLASDFTMLNGRLAQHYGIPDVDGWEFQKTTLPPESHRGGVLTMAGVLKVTANGTSTSPVLRGAWVLERILGVTPPRPPADVPALEPDIRGATTIREQLALHRDNAACASCHKQIDPPGFALESFDVIGGYREKYRFAGWRRDAEELTINGRKVYLDLAVDPTATLPDGRSFANVDEFKQLLLDDKDQFARALTTKLITYATGGPPTEFDRPTIDAIIEKIHDNNDGFRSLIHAIVDSDLFQMK